MTDGFNPYHKWLGIPPAEQPANHYRLLGIGLFEDDVDVIEGAYDKAMAHVRTFQAGPHSALSQQILNELAAARLTLLDPQKKAAYDRHLEQTPPAPVPGVGTVPAAPIPVAIASAATIADATPQQAPFASLDVSSSTQRNRPARSPLAGPWTTVLAALCIGVLISGAAIYRFKRTQSADGVENPGDEQTVSVKEAPAGSHHASATPLSGPPNGKDKQQTLSVGPDLVSSEDESATASPDSVDLLAKIDPTRDAAHGKWEKRGRRLQTPATAFARLEIPFEMPEEYELTGTIECVSHTDGFGLVLPVGTVKTTLIVDGFNQTTWLDRVDESGGDNETAKRGRFLQDGQPNTIVCTVRKTGVNVACNGKMLIDWTGDASRLSAAPWWEPGAPRHLSLGTLGSSYSISELELRPLGAASSAITPRIREISLQELSNSQPPAGPATTSGVDAGPPKGAGAMENLNGNPQGGVAVDQPAAGDAPDSSQGSLSDLFKKPEGLPPPPEGETLLQANDAVENRYKSDWAAAKTPQLKVELARRLYNEALRTRDDAALRYSLLDKAWRLAADSGGVEAAFSAIDELGRSFAVDPLALKLGALKTASQSPPNLPFKREQLDSALELIETAADDDRYAEARRAASLAMQAARALKDQDANELLRARQTELERQSRAYAAGKAALEKLQTNPNDAEAHLAAGKYFCFTKGDWDEGLKHLAVGSDEALQALARSESAPPSGVSEERAMGDAWREQWQKEKSTLKTAFAERAAHWYRRVLPFCAGADKLTLEQHIKEIDGQTATGKLQFLSELPEISIVVPNNWFSKGTNVLTGRPIRIGGEPSPHALLLHPPEKGFSSVKYDLAKKAQRLSLAVAIDDPAQASIRTPLVFQVYGDGRLLWTSPKIFRDQTARCYLDMRTVGTLELRVNCRGSDWSAHGVWVEPRVTWK